MWCTSLTQNSPDASSSIPESMGKDILSFNIPLDTCGMAGLGVTVHGSKKKQSGGDMGIYIKSIVPGGAAAQVILGEKWGEGSKERFLFQVWYMYLYGVDAVRDRGL